MKNQNVMKAVTLSLSGILLISGVSPNAYAARANKTATPKTSIEQTDESLLRLSLNGVQYTFSMPEFSTKLPAKDMKLGTNECYLNLQVQVTNQTKQEIGLTALMQFGLTDKNGQTYSLTLPETTNSLNGTLAPGKSQIGVLRFTVSKNIKDYVLTLTPDMNQTSNAVINVSAESLVLESYNEQPIAKQRSEAANEESVANSVTLESKAGRHVVVEGVSYTIDKVAFETIDKKSCMVLTMRVKNTDKTQKALTAVTQFSLTNKSGHIYNLVMPEPKDSLNGLLDPGKTLKGRLVFEVPKKTTGTLLQINL